MVHILAGASQTVQCPTCLQFAVDQCLVLFDAVAMQAAWGVVAWQNQEGVARQRLVGAGWGEEEAA